MVNATIGELRGSLAEYVDRVAQDKERVIVTRHGREAAAIVPVADLKLIERIERQIDELIARAALAEIREQGAIPWEEAARRLAAQRPNCR